MKKKMNNTAAVNSTPMVYSERILLIISKGIYADSPFIAFFIARVPTEAIPDDIIDDAIYTARNKTMQKRKTGSEGKITIHFSSK